MKAIALILGVAVSASAATVALSRAWHLDSRVSVLEKEDGVRLLVSERSGPCAGTIGCANLTRDEAASLGRALLEASGVAPSRNPADLLEKEGACVPSYVSEDEFFCKSSSSFYIKKSLLRVKE